ncbi:MAG: HAD family hydrolase [Clostridiales bacterium]|nr:HAD family hydrolase [Clostridiales bacterium]
MKLSKPINGIFLDIGWTLVSPATGHWMIPLKAMEFVDTKTLESIPKERVNEAFAKCTKYLDENHLIRTVEEEYAQFAHFYKMLSDHLPELNITSKQIELITHDKVYNTENYIFFDDVKDTLIELNKKYKLGIISDTYPSIKFVLEKAGILNFFDTITFSCDLGVLKPNPRMYQHALDNMNLPAHETLFVDDLVGNLKGASDCGIQTVLIDIKKKQNKQNNILTIHKFSDLLLYL